VLYRCRKSFYDSKYIYVHIWVEYYTIPYSIILFNSVDPAIAGTRQEPALDAGQPHGGTGAASDRPRQHGVPHDLHQGFMDDGMAAAAAVQFVLPARAWTLGHTPTTSALDLLLQSPKFKEMMTSAAESSTTSPRLPRLSMSTPTRPTPQSSKDESA
jgi:hypothetical protein